MAQLTQRQAAQTWSIPWTTFRRAVQSGKVSVGADKKVDSAEMVRAFGEPPAQQSGPSGTNEFTQPTHATEIENARLKAENEALRELVKRADAERDRAIETMKLLGHEAQKARRRWWSWSK